MFVIVLLSYCSRPCLLISGFVISLKPSSASGLMDTETHGEKERERERERERESKHESDCQCQTEANRPTVLHTVMWLWFFFRDSVYSFTCETAYPMHMSDLVLFHYAALNPCHMSSEVLPKTTLSCGVLCLLVWGLWSDGVGEVEPCGGGATCLGDLSCARWRLWT